MGAAPFTADLVTGWGPHFSGALFGAAGGCKAETACPTPCPNPPSASLAASRAGSELLLGHRAASSLAQNPRFCCLEFRIQLFQASFLISFVF